MNHTVHGTQLISDLNAVHPTAFHTHFINSWACTSKKLFFKIFWQYSIDR